MRDSILLRERYVCVCVCVCVYNEGVGVVVDAYQCVYVFVSAAVGMCMYVCVCKGVCIYVGPWLCERDE